MDRAEQRDTDAASVTGRHDDDAPGSQPPSRGPSDDMSPQDGQAADGEPAQPNDRDSAKDEADAARKSKKRRFWLIGFLVLVALLVAGGVAAYWFLYAAHYESTDDAYVDGEIVRVSPEVAGKLVDVTVEENTHVRPGDVLAKIDPAGPQAELALKQAQLGQAQAAVGQAEAQIEQAKTAVAREESNLTGAQATANNARTQADRLQELAKRAGSAAISQQQLDDAQAQAQQAEANLDAAQKSVANAKAGVSAAQAGRAAAQAQVQAAEADVAASQVTVDQLTLTAPIAGQVVQQNVNLGSYVQPGSEIMAIVPEDLYVTANFKETQLADIRIGQSVDISVDAFPDVDFKGKVVSIQHGAGQAFQILPPQNATGNFVKVVQRVPVRISIESPSLADYPIGPGMSVVPTVDID
ncbi:HlyD family secretion protein [Mangrovibrevibacter kandeliae]|uniref:HlyD family secretion protein n=1 Tax=Mangrovibrevibacter kandeliae TaxID=2968473 RepID=UPI002119119F|nr:HlyD family secretion protein [Aurantimonas sp. CSK15Z-1]MCQ8783802.1 HlyD family secretion protein [Aurantimonas sp. CSK15Z-1]